MALLNINNVDMPKPTTYQVSVQDLDSSESVRSESGVLHRDRVRAGVRKIEVGWTVRTAESSKILKAVSGESFTVKFFDPQQNSVETATMYAGDKTVSLKNLIGDTGAATTLWEVSFSLIVVLRRGDCPSLNRRGGIGRGRRRYRNRRRSRQSATSRARLRVLTASRLGTDFVKRLRAGREHCPMDWQFGRSAMFVNGTKIALTFFAPVAGIDVAIIRLLFR